MDVRRLRYFLAVARELNFTRAAASLYMSVPPLSQRIRELEADLDCDLFVRTTRSVSLTTAGERLLPLAARIVADVDRVCEVVREETPRLVVTVGIPDALGATQRRALTELVNATAQDIHVEVQHVPSLNIDRALTTRAIDIGLGRVRSTHPDLVEVVLTAEAVSVVCDAVHFAPGRVIRPADLRGFALLEGPRHWQLRPDVERAPLRNAGVVADHSTSYSDLGSMLVLLRGHRRFALVPSDADMLRGIDASEIGVHPVSAEVPPLVLSLVRRRAEPWLDAFWSECLIALGMGQP